MPKLKLPRKSTNVDMTAMCDVAFLLLSFFMLATKFKKEEPVQVTTPSSISEMVVPDQDIMLITIDSKSRVFFSIDEPIVRKTVIENMNTYQKGNLSADDMKYFEASGTAGVPFSQLKAYLEAPTPQQKELDASSPGIPTDTSVNNPNNELASWIRVARDANPKLRIVIKADGKTAYPGIQKVIGTLAGWKIFKFNLITSLHDAPKGTAAYADKQAEAAAKK